MIAWTKRGPALVGALTLGDGRPAVAALVAGRDNPRGASLVVAPPEGGAPAPVALSEGLAMVRPADLIEVLCMQERCFGLSGLPLPEGVAGWS